ncbi:hypothetical protein NDR87_31015 [Nocardia sp. CDC159]|uniref:Uncharacterized protein n=1 Tax=Nocardia pulmonis TaxID=2951408 RepID=A0A9X2EGY8_9NOCA|nr:MULTISPECIES: hypothetical protein [Nocardia]MCM6778018.1 hypothetical protein [Nocardia pulmonis]MCM6790811.1 hypothetical protein [Nocardia sp. CDC159]
MAKVFETIYADGIGREITEIRDHQWHLWCAAFTVQSLEGMFDLTPATRAIPILDAAIARFNAAPDDLRTALHPEDWLMLRGNRRLMEKMRATLADHPDATISGVHEDTE